jgi:hypothetical protein
MAICSRYLEKVACQLSQTTKISRVMTMELANTDRKFTVSAVSEARKPLMIVTVLWAGSAAILLAAQFL